MFSKKAIALCATVGVALSGFAIATPAFADPVSNSYTIVGSDTLEDVVSALANGTAITGSSVRSTVNKTSIGSFDATGSPYITTKSSGVRFGRPNGSGDGVKALSRSIDGAAYTSGTTGSPTNVIITGQVDIARSSSAGTANVNGELMYVPFGRDAIAYAYKGTANGIDGITASQMKSLYECSSGFQIGGTTVTPIIPQAGSGTRKDFLAKIGSSEALMLTVGEGGCVVEGQEHDATSLTAESVMPMAVSRWIAMNTGASYDKRGTGTLGSLVTGVAPVTGTGSSMVPNAPYYADTTWGRDTYLVVEYARVNSADAKYDANLAKLLDSAQSTALTNTSSVVSRAGAVKKKFGFLAPTSGVVAYRVAKTA
jgi:ABC-type phosphate transport system substrate-binding protein